jgi:hypothetical protein
MTGLRHRPGCRSSILGHLVAAIFCICGWHPGSRRQTWARRLSPLRLFEDENHFFGDVLSCSVRPHLLAADRLLCDTRRRQPGRRSRTFIEHEPSSCFKLFTIMHTALSSPHAITLSMLARRSARHVDPHGTSAPRCPPSLPPLRSYLASRRTLVRATASLFLSYVRTIRRIFMQQGKDDMPRSEARRAHAMLSALASRACCGCRREFRFASHGPTLPWTLRCSPERLAALASLPFRP